MLLVASMNGVRCNVRHTHTYTHTHTHIQYLSRGCERAVNIKKTERARVHSEVSHPVRLCLYAAVSLSLAVDTVPLSFQWALITRRVSKVCPSFSQYSSMQHNRWEQQLANYYYQSTLSSSSASCTSGRKNVRFMPPPAAPERGEATESLSLFCSTMVCTKCQLRTWQCWRKYPKVILE